MFVIYWLSLKVLGDEILFCRLLLVFGDETFSRSMLNILSLIMSNLSLELNKFLFYLFWVTKYFVIKNSDRIFSDENIRHKKMQKEKTLQ